MNIRTPLWILSFRKPKGFKNSVPETGTKTKYIFHIIKHNITCLCVYIYAWHGRGGGMFLAFTRFPKSLMVSSEEVWNK